jgi:peroxiredoxin Q/BCP
MAVKKATSKKGSSSKASRRDAPPKKAAVAKKKPAAPVATAVKKPSPGKTAAKAGNGSGRAERANRSPAAAESGSRGGVQIGDSAPSFVLQDQTGAMVSSETLRGSSYLIYFYPKDDTPGCTLEACSFRDSMPRFNAKGVRVLGVSPDAPDAHARFAKKYGLPFSLLSDPEKTLAKAYGVWVMKKNYGREYLGVERSTFFVDRSGVVRKIWRAVRVPGHVDEVVHTV